MTDLVLGIDVGTTSAKAVLIARDGTLHGRGSSDPIPTRSPEPGGSEQDPYELRQAVAVACRRALGDTDTRPRVLAVAAGAQSGSLVAIGSDDEPVGPVITWMDTRSRPLLDSWPSEVRERVRAVSGWSALPGLGLASICWLRQCRPEQFGDACRFASADDLVTRWLTGRWVSNPSNASGLQLMDVGELRWSDELCELAGISPRQLSALQPTGSVHGRLTAAAATATGLGEGTMVLVGGHDQACAALGLGVIDPGSAFLAAGTAWVLTVVTDRAAIGELPISLNLSPHVLPGRWSASTSLGGMGAAISWWLGQPPGRHSDEVRPPGEPAIAKSSPFFAPAVGDHERRGWGRFERVGPSHGHGHRELAVFEAAAFEVRRALGHILWITGPLDHLVAVGGASANPRLLQVLADVVGLPIRVVGEASWPAVGAARIAATAIGWHLPRSAPERATTSTRTVVPDPAAVAVHTERWTTYRRLSGEEHDQERSGDP